MKLIKNAGIYAPEYIGEKDVLLAGGKICRIGENLTVPDSWDVEIIDGSGMLLLPGFIDSHEAETSGALQLVSLHSSW